MEIAITLTISRGKKTKRGIWAAFDFSECGYKPKSDVTVIVSLEFEYFKITEKFRRRA